MHYQKTHPHENLSFLLVFYMAMVHLGGNKQKGNENSQQNQ